MKREVDGNKVEVGGEGRDRSNTLLKCCHAAFRLKKKIHFMILKQVAMFFFLYTYAPNPHLYCSGAEGNDYYYPTDCWIH